MSFTRLYKFSYTINKCTKRKYNFLIVSCKIRCLLNLLLFQTSCDIAQSIQNVHLLKYRFLFD